MIRHRNFRRLFATRLVSQGADGAFQAALASLFFFSPERQTSAGSVAAAFAVLLLPYSIVGPFAGVLLDRWRRRQVLVVREPAARGDGPRRSRRSAPPTCPARLLYGAVLACLSVNRFFLAGLSAALPHVVARDELVMANSVSTTSGTIVAILGAGIGYGLKSLFGDGRQRRRAGHRRRRARLRRGRADRRSACTATCSVPTSRASRRRPGKRYAGSRAVSSTARATCGPTGRPAYALAAIGAHRFFYGISTITAILLFRRYFHDPDDVDAGLAGLAGAFAASGIGFFLAAVITPEVTARWRKETWIWFCFALAAVTEAVFVVVLAEWALLPRRRSSSASPPRARRSASTRSCRRSVDDAYRGRVFSFYDVLFNVAFVAAAAFAAAVLPADGNSRIVFAVVAGGYAPLTRPPASG